MKDGSPRWHLSRGVPVRSEDGKVVRWFGTATDIHQQKLAELDLSKANEALARANAALLESETRYRLAARATNDAVWDWDLRTDQVHWNESAAGMFGYEDIYLQDTTGSWWEDKIHPEDRQRVVSSLHAVIDGPADHWTQQYRFQLSDGTYAVIYDRCWVMRDYAGRPVRMLGAMQDITERQKAEEALRESEARFRGTFENAAVGITHLSLQGEILRSNDRMCLKIGYTWEDLNHLPFSQIIHPDDRAAAWENVEQVLRGQAESYRGEARLVRKNGQTLWAMLTFSLQLGAQGNRSTCWASSRISPTASCWKNKTAS
jgi:PAS domain S-box-containing protein